MVASAHAGGWGGPLAGELVRTERHDPVRACGAGHTSHITLNNKDTFAYKALNNKDTMHT